MNGMNQTFVGSPIIVIGMHRSGTSLVSQLLQKMGVHIGADTTRTHESAFFREVNRRLMRRFSARWHRPQPMWQVVSDQARIDDSAKRFESACQSGASRAYFGAASLQDSPWGWKDPRSTVTLPIWLQRFPEAKVVHVVRNGIDVADSLMRRSRIEKRQAWTTRLRTAVEYVVPGIRPRNVPQPFSTCRFRSLDDAFELWQCYLSFAEYGIRQLPQHRLHVLRFEDLAAQPMRELHRLATFAGCCPTTSAVDGMAVEIDSRRAWSFEDRNDLRDFADRMASDATMQQYGYGADCRVRAESVPENTDSSQAA